MPLTIGHSLALVFALWLGLFLGGLGQPEISNNEIRRIEPAMHMIQTGDWLVPRLEGDIYFNKPPMLFWLEAMAFNLAGGRSETVARLPAALMPLALALMLVTLPCRWLSPKRRLLAAVLYLGTAGVVLNGREAAIDGLFAAAAGMALFWWLTAELDGWRRFWKWLPAALILGFALLLKGPLVLLFFYAAILAVLGARKRWRELLAWEHAAALTVMVAIFAAWAIPACHTISSNRVFDLWGEEFSQTLSPQKTAELGRWLNRMAGALTDLLPPLLFLPLLWLERFKTLHGRTNTRVARALGLASLAAILLTLLMPGAKARYVLPAAPALSLLAAWALPDWETAAGWNRFKTLCGNRLPSILAALAGLIAGAGMVLAADPRGRILCAVIAAAAFLAALLWLRKPRKEPGLTICDLTIGLTAILAVTATVTAYIMPRFIQPEMSLRHFAARIEYLVPDSARLYHVNPSRNGFRFYLHRPLYYAKAGRNIEKTTTDGFTPPDEIFYVLLLLRKAGEVNPAAYQLAGRRGVPVVDLKLGEETFLLFKMGATAEPAGPTGPIGPARPEAAPPNRPPFP